MALVSVVRLIRRAIILLPGMSFLSVTLASANTGYDVAPEPTLQQQLQRRQMAGDPDPKRQKTGRDGRERPRQTQQQPTPPLPPDPSPPQRALDELMLNHLEVQHRRQRQEHARLERQHLDLTNEMINISPVNGAFTRSVISQSHTNRGGDFPVRELQQHLSAVSEAALAATRRRNEVARRMLQKRRTLELRDRVMHGPRVALSRFRPARLARSSSLPEGNPVGSLSAQRSVLRHNNLHVIRAHETRAQDAEYEARYWQTMGELPRVGPGPPLRRFGRIPPQRPPPLLRAPVERWAAVEEERQDVARERERAGEPAPRSERSRSVEVEPRAPAQAQSATLGPFKGREPSSP